MSSRVFAPDLLDGRVVLLRRRQRPRPRDRQELTAVGTLVVICRRRDVPLRETVALCPPGRCRAEVCDLREEDQVEALVEATLARHGRIDVLINNAGGQYLTAAEEITPKGFRTVMRLNAESALLMTHSVATKAMIPAGGGKVINVTLSPHTGMPGMAHSTASRAAVESLTRVLAIAWARFGITINALAAGHFATQTFKTKYPRSVVEEAAGTVPLQRLGRPEELAWLARYLASEAGDHFSGSVLTFDGARDVWRGSFPTHDYVDASGAIVAEARSNGHTTERAST